MLMQLTLKPEVSIMEKTFVLNGKSYTGNFNANGELSKAVEGLDKEVLINWPRHHNRANGSPVIELEKDKFICLGWMYYTDEEKKTYNAYTKSVGSGATKAAKPAAVPVNFAKEVIDKCSKELSDEARAFFQDIIDKDSEAKAKKTEQLKALMSGFSKEELMAMLG